MLLCGHAAMSRTSPRIRSTRISSSYENCGIFLKVSRSGSFTKTIKRVPSDEKLGEWLRADPSNVHLHFTLAYSSWLNQVELWFAKIERHVIGRGIFTSVTDLAKKLMRYIRHYNKAPKTVKWRYI